MDSLFRVALAVPVVGRRSEQLIADLAIFLCFGRGFDLGVLVHNSLVFELHCDVVSALFGDYGSAIGGTFRVVPSDLEVSGLMGLVMAGCLLRSLGAGFVLVSHLVFDQLFLFTYLVF